MENTLENKAKFFALYWGQELLNGTGLVYSATMKTRLSDNGDYLELKPLSSITDEEKRIIDEMEGVGDEENPEGYFNYGNKYENCYYRNGDFVRFPLLETYQFLQSKGYALPWMGLSVEKMVEYGWIKLTE